MLRSALLNDVQSQSATLAVVAIKESFLIRPIAQLHRLELYIYRILVCICSERCYLSVAMGFIFPHFRKLLYIQAKYLQILL